jgi:asparagine synthase (glutamine-hydrolysing)
MCGIAGIVGRVMDSNRGALRRIAGALAHRGPDAHGFWESPADARGDGCLLAHRRLSILDLSAAADQPMVDARTGDVIVFNGEVYNFRELRAEMQRRGEAFASSGDTEVMLRILAVGGYKAVRRLRGMFAFGMWDGSERQLVLARDPLGMKPLYVCRNPDTSEGREWSLAFASELRAILASGLLGKPRLDPAAVASVVWNGFVMGPGTAVAGVESLGAGEVWVVDARGKTAASEVYWSLPASAGSSGASIGGGQQSDTSEHALREALLESVRLHLVSDVPLGVFLSGGVDSSAVANLAQQASAEPVNTFTLAFEEKAYDESAFARRVAEAIGSRHREVTLTEGQFVASLEAALDSLDQPTFDGLNSYYVSKAVREAGLTVAVAGTGGDELFGGYTSFRQLPQLYRWARRTRGAPQELKVFAAKVASALLRRRGRKAAAGAGTVGPQTKWAKLPEMARAGEDLIGLYQLAYALFLPDFQRELMNGTAGDAGTRYGLPPRMRRRLEAETRGRSPLAAVAALEQRCFLGERLLRDTDAASMAVSLETRLPLVDQVFVERVYRMRDRRRFAPLGRKQMLRTVGLWGLDRRMFERPKSGFVLPFDDWIRRRLGGEMDAMMRDHRAAASVGLDGRAVERLWETYRGGGPGMYWSRVWAVYVLMRWCQRHGVVV